MRRVRSAAPSSALTVWLVGGGNFPINSGLDGLDPLVSFTGEEQHSESLWWGLLADLDRFNLTRLLRPDPRSQPVTPVPSQGLGEPWGLVTSDRILPSRGLSRRVCGRRGLTPCHLNLFCENLERIGREEGQGSKLLGRGRVDRQPCRKGGRDAGPIRP